MEEEIGWGERDRGREEKRERNRKEGGNERRKEKTK